MNERTAQKWRRKIPKDLESTLWTRVREMKSSSVYVLKCAKVVAKHIAHIGPEPWEPSHETASTHETVLHELEACCIDYSISWATSTSDYLKCNRSKWSFTQRDGFRNVPFERLAFHKLLMCVFCLPVVECEIKSTLPGLIADIIASSYRWVYCSRASAPIRKLWTRVKSAQTLH